MSDDELEEPIVLPSEAKRQITGKDRDARKDLVQEEKEPKRTVQFCQSCRTICGPMECSTPGLLVLHKLPEFIQTHVHSVGDIIKPSNSLLSPSPPTFNLFQHQGILKQVSSLHQVDKV